MGKAKRFNPPYTVGIVEDVPGEKFYVIGGDHVFFARMPAVDARMEATAEFIVRAVNCHDELLAACKAALDALGFIPAPTRPDQDAIDACRAAIARAESEPAYPTIKGDSK